MVIQKKQLTELPDEILSKICEDLSVLEIKNFCNTSKRFSHLFSESLRLGTKPHESGKLFFQRVDLLGRACLDSLHLSKEENVSLYKVPLKDLKKVSSEMFLKLKMHPFHLEATFEEHFSVLVVRAIASGEEKLLETVIKNPSMQKLPLEFFLKCCLKATEHKHAAVFTYFMQCSQSALLRQDDIFLLLCFAVEKDHGDSIKALVKQPLFTSIGAHEIKSVLSAVIMQGKSELFKLLISHPHIKTCMAQDLAMIFKYCALFARKEMIHNLLEDPYFMESCPDGAKIVLVEASKAGYRDLLEVFKEHQTLHKLLPRETGKMLIEAFTSHNYFMIEVLLDPSQNLSFEMSFFISTLLIAVDETQEAIFDLLVRHPLFLKIGRAPVIALLSTLADREDKKKIASVLSLPINDEIFSFLKQLHANQPKKLSLLGIS